MAQQAPIVISQIAGIAQEADHHEPRLLSSTWAAPTESGYSPLDHKSTTIRLKNFQDRHSDIGCEVGRPLRQAGFPLAWLRRTFTFVLPVRGWRLAHHFTNEENGLVLRRYWTNACRTCALKAQCTKGPQRRITRWENEYVVDAVQARLDRNPDAMRTRRETVEHPFGTLKMRMGATHFLMKTLPKVATEMALHVLAYNLTRVMNLLGIKPLLAAIRA